MPKQDRIKVNLLFALRIILWIVALAATVYWAWFSVKLTSDGVYDPIEYGTALRPVLYPCLIISVLAIAASFGLYAMGKKIKDKYKLSKVTNASISD